MSPGRRILLLRWLLLPMLLSTQADNSITDEVDSGPREEDEEVEAEADYFEDREEEDADYNNDDDNYDGDSETEEDREANVERKTQLTRVWHLLFPLMANIEMLVIILICIFLSRIFTTRD